MHISTSTFFLAGLSIIGLVSAAPAPSRTSEDKSLHPRACQTVFPTFITKIYEASPDQVGNADNSFFEVEYDFNGSPERKERDAVVQFEFIPPNAYGCSLEAFFPAGARVEGHGDNRVDVFAVDRSSPVSEFSWNQSPKPTYLFGSVKFFSRPDQAVRTVINSISCKSTLTFRFTISSTANSGGVFFWNGPNFGGQGLRLVHSC